MGTLFTETLDGFDIVATTERDDDAGAPWERDGHGDVSDWIRRTKRPGELVLNRDRDRARYYDFAGAVKIAKRDGWGPGTPEQAARADFERLRDWCADRWEYVGVIVTASKEGIKLSRQSLWGIESDSGDYLKQVAREMAADAVRDASDVIGRLSASKEG